MPKSSRHSYKSTYISLDTAVLPYIMYFTSSEFIHFITQFFLMLEAQSQVMVIT